MTSKEIKRYSKILKQINFNEEDFTFYVLFAFIINHYPNTDIQKLQYIDEIEPFQDALEDILKYVKNNDLANTRFIKSVFNLWRQDTEGFMIGGVLPSRAELTYGLLMLKCSIFFLIAHEYTHIAKFKNDGTSGNIRNYSDYGRGVPSPTNRPGNQ